jgi:uncharacterized protein YjbJ (UPF0337 family)
MDTNQDILLAKWHQLKWGKLSDDDTAQLSGKTEILAGILQQRYGYSRAQAEIEINKLLCGRGRRTACSLASQCE